MSEDLYLLVEFDDVTGNMKFYRSGRNYTIAVYDNIASAKKIKTMYKKRNLSIVTVDGLKVVE